MVASSPIFANESRMSLAGFRNEILNISCDHHEIPWICSHVVTNSGDQLSHQIRKMMPKIRQPYRNAAGFGSTEARSEKNSYYRWAPKGSFYEQPRRKSHADSGVRDGSNRSATQAPVGGSAPPYPPPYPPTAPAIGIPGCIGMPCIGMPCIGIPCGMACPPNPPKPANPAIRGSIGGAPIPG